MRSYVALLLLALGTRLALASSPEVLVLMDCSGSMLESVAGQKRIDGAKEALAAMIDRIPAGTKLGMRLFAHRYGGRSDEQKARSCTDTELIFPIALPDRAAMKARVTQITCKGWTPLAHSLEQAGKDFADTADVERTLVVLSDGEETCGGDPVAVARQLKASGLKIVTDVIGFGVDASTRKQLEAVAGAGGGKYYNAADASALALSLTQAIKAAPPPPPPTPTPTPPPSPKPTLGFVDEFDGGELASDTWERLNPDDNRFLVEGGKLLIVCRGLQADEPFNRLRFRRPLPRDFEAILDLETDRQDGNWVMLTAVQDENTSMEAWLDHHDQWQHTRSHFRKTIAGEKNEVQSGECHRGLPKRYRFQLRLRKEGRDWQSTLAAGGQACTLKQTVLKLTPAYIELFATNDTDGRQQKEVHLLRFQLKDLSSTPKLPPAAQEDPASGSSQTGPESDRPASPPPVEFPDIKCQGVMKMGGASVVLIKSRTYKAGQTVSGAKILAIDQDEVTFSFRGKTFKVPSRSE